MDSRVRDVSLGFTQRKLPEGTHLCYVYDGDVERRRVIAEYLGAGVESDEHVAYFADPGTEEALQWLAEAGVAAATTESKGQVHVSVAESTYCPDGHFSPEAMFETLRRFRRQADEAGYSGSRVSGEMAWALRGAPGSERLLEYEARVTPVLSECGITAICQYDTSRWDGATILHVLRVHPYMVVRGQVWENPYYMAAEEYLREYGGRRPA